MKSKLEAGLLKYHKHREKNLARSREYYLANREKRIRQMRENYRKNRERELAKKKEYREDHLLKIKQKDRRLYLRDRERILARQKDYYQRRGKLIRYGLLQSFKPKTSCSEAQQTVATR
jgi:hypothetical protein